MKAVIFDWDGTIIKSKRANFHAFKKLHDEFNLNSVFTMKEFVDWYSPNWYMIYEKMGIPEEEWARANELWRKAYPQKGSRLSPNSARILANLKSKRFKIGLVTNGNEKRVISGLKRKGIFNIFDVVICGDHVPIEEQKPSPRQIVLALERLNIKPKDAVYVGDTSFDVLAGKNAGVKTVALIGGLHSVGKLKNSNPDLLVHDWKELESKIEEIWM
jgi:HAD superfamily hydrolase (TIGR01662 family)